MGTTTRGFRYPEATDRVTDGATAMANLAGDIDTWLGAAVPRAHVGPAADVAIAAGATAIMTIASNDLLTGGMTVTGTRLVVPTAGLYRVSAQARIDITTPGTTANILFRIMRNAASVTTAGQTVTGAYTTADSANTAPILASRLITLAANDHLEVFATGPAGSASTLKAGLSVSFLSVELVR